MTHTVLTGAVARERAYRRIRRLIALCASSALLLVAGGVSAATTGTWTTTGTTVTSPAVGVTVTWSGAIGGANPYSNGTFNTTNFWNNPYTGTVAGANALNMTIPPNTYTITVTFSKAVDNPVLHLDRVGGSSGGQNNSSLWTLSGSVSTGGSVGLTRLSGNSVFIVSGNTFQRTTGGAAAGSTECNTTAANGTGCGSIRFDGTGITSLTFTVTAIDPGGGSAGDGLEAIWSLAGSDLRIVKQTLANTGSFPFTGSNGVGPVTLNTATLNPATSAVFPIANHSQPITVTESAVTGFALQSAICRDQSNAVVTSSLAGNALTIAAANYRANQNITCTFVNATTSDLTIAKSDVAASYTPGGGTSYTLIARNFGAVTISAAQISDALPAGATLSGPWSCLASAGSSCSAANGGAVGGNTVSLTVNLLANGTATITVPVAFNANAGAY
ncbi:hypothetical protein ASD78_05135 [Lysobacter sp. Root667]|uniref:prealbumin-like fold domain-containing protein n=1 Tax=Lysobacter sp. Root667 TaxID=1736581 RepID=UPI0006F54C37|nr:DUF11 domain-containing protein [Lysobacter sp. Root667]KRA76998.1 hypothetical protein ASD78_05135 [Lysobacter sp. Root667]